MPSLRKKTLPRSCSAAKGLVEVSLSRGRTLRPSGAVPCPRLRPAEADHARPSRAPQRGPRPPLLPSLPGAGALTSARACGTCCPPWSEVPRGGQGAPLRPASCRGGRVPRTAVLRLHCLGSNLIAGKNLMKKTDPRESESGMQQRPGAHDFTSYSPAPRRS